jgi:transcriptional regulator with XRE-family HTH domain
MRKTLYSSQQAVFSAKLAKLRRESGLTQRDLAKRLKRHHSIIANVESGQRRVDVLEFIAWCEALRHDPVKVLIEIRADIKRQ